MKKECSETNSRLPAGFAGNGIWHNPWLYCALIVIAALMLYSKFVFSDAMLFGSDTMSSLDARAIYEQGLRQDHQVPFWFPSRLGGMPSIDAMFGDVFYLPAMVFHTFFTTHRALGYKIVFHVLLAGIFFFFMLNRGFHMPALVAFAGALFYMYNPQFISHTYPGHDGKMYVIAWLPFMVWRLKALMERPTLMNSSLLSLGIAFSLFTSHIQMTYFALWGLFAYWVFALILHWRSSDRSGKIFKPGILFWAGVVVALGAASIQLYPSFMYVREAFSVRGVDRGFEHAASWSLHWPEFFSLWVPEFGNHLQSYWSANPFKLNSEYAGAMALLCAVLAVIGTVRPWRYFWAGVALFAALYSMGAHTPVFHVVYAIVPGVKKFRACSMFMFWYAFATVVLSSLFLKDVMAGKFSSMSEAGRKKWTRGLAIAIGSLTVVALLFSMEGFVRQMFAALLTDSRKAQVFDANFQKNFLPMLWLWWLFACGVLGLLLGVIRGSVPRSLFLGVVVLIGLIDTVRINTQFISVVNPRKYMYDEPAIVDLQTRMKKEPFRCFSLPGAFSGQNSEGIHKLEGVGGFHDNELRWYRQFRGDQSDRNYLTNLVSYGPDGQGYLQPAQLQSGNTWLNLANARYILVRQANRLVPVENRAALPRLGFVPGYAVKSEEQIEQDLKAGRLDIRGTVTLLEEPENRPASFDGESGSEQDGSSGAIVEWKHYSVNKRVAHVTTRRDGFMRLSEVYYPGWHILVDGKPVRYYRSDLAWMAFYLDKGEHVIEMLPRSLYFNTAARVSFTVIALLLVYWAVMGTMHFVRRRSGGERVTTA